MAWLGKVTLGNFGDIAGAVTKLSESVKNIEKNFDSALGFDDKSVANDEPQGSTGEKRTLLDPVLAFVGQKDLQKESSTTEIFSWRPPVSEGGNMGLGDHVSNQAIEGPVVGDNLKSVSLVDQQTSLTNNALSPECNNNAESCEGKGEQVQPSVRETPPSLQNPEHPAKGPVDEMIRIHGSEQVMTATAREDDVHSNGQEVPLSTIDRGDVNLNSNISNQSEVVDHDLGGGTRHCAELDPQGSGVTAFGASVPSLIIGNDELSVSSQEHKKFDISTGAAPFQSDVPLLSDLSKQNLLSVEENLGDVDLLKAEVKMLEATLQGAANQAKTKADEISMLLLENDNLRSIIEDLKKKSGEAEQEAMREEFQQRLNAAERKVYALTKERDMLRREQSRKDSSILLKEKDEIIKQVMAEGEELSKKQAAQEAQMRKLRAQIRELEEEKQRLKSKLQVEEATVESIRKDKAATEKALQDAVEKAQVELAIQKDFYTNALNDAKEAQAQAEARADNEAKIELERRLCEAGDREAALVQNLDELRQALSRASQQAASREDMLQRDVEDLERRCQAAERRYEELVASVPESTRPLLRQIEAIRESTAMRAEAWSGVERALNARLQEAEAKAAASQERERSINERLTQTLSRMAVLEAQVSCLKAEHAQLTRSLEKERQRASENRQEYLAALESAATYEGRAKQVEEDLKDLQTRSKRELAEEKTIRQLLEQELEHEKKKQMENETLLRNGSWTITDKANTQPEVGQSRSVRRFSSANSGSNLEESYFLQASLDSKSDQLVGDKINSSTPVTTPHTVKGVFPNATREQLEMFLAQKDGELALYTSRIASLESTRDELAEELVKATTQCEKLRSEVSSLPRINFELESLRRRHTSALELMGERDEEVEELKADLADVKQMYREQIDMLVNQIEKLSISIGSR